MVPDGKDHRRKVQWQDTLERNTIILYDFELTKSCHLKKETVMYLQKHYESL